MTEKRLHIVLLLLCTLMVVFSVSIGSKLPNDVATIVRAPVVVEDSATSARLSLINAAVKIEPNRNYFSYTGGFENPFRLEGASAGGGSSGKASPKIARVKMALKGILTKDRPIAILEAPSGETFIRGAGEKAGDQTVVSIKDNRVTLRDQTGTYDVVVEEK